MATNMFVQFSNIEGECEEKHHPKWCEITSLEQEFSNATIPLPPGEPEGAGAQPCQHDVIKITKLLDKASTELMKACWAGDTVDTVLIECFRAGKGLDHTNQAIKYFRLKLKSVIIKALDFATTEGELISEDLELVAAEVTYTYRQMDKKTGTAKRAGIGYVQVGEANRE
ncbi:MAG: type VI secretion system tube protein Hcp [Desulfobacterales bacterium]|nr:type VI secretion system tube protein Hcp [Desulfobacterales bacterium]